MANTGLALAAAGVPTRVCSRVGNDPLGEIARRLLAEHGMDLEDVTTTAGAATSYSIVLQLPDHDRTFWHHPGANTVFTGREVNLDGVDILHLGYPPLLPALLADDATPPQSAEGGSQSTNHYVARPGRGGSTVQSAAVDWRQVFARIMPYVDIATPSIDDLTSALAITRPRDDDLVEECARCLINDGCAVAVVSAGARGAYAVSAGPDRLAVAGAALSSVRSTWSSTAEWVPAAEPRLVVQHDRSGRYRHRRTPLRPGTRDRHSAGNSARFPIRRVRHRGEATLGGGGRPLGCRAGRSRPGLTPWLLAPPIKHVLADLSERVER